MDEFFAGARRFLDGLANLSVVGLTQWPLNALEGGILATRRIIRLCFVLLVVALLLMMIFKISWIAIVAAFLLLPLVYRIVRSRDAFLGGELLVAVDVARDVVDNIRPVTLKHIGEVFSGNLSIEHVKKLELLLWWMKAMYFVVVTTAFTLFVLSFIKIWECSIQQVLQLVFAIILVAGLSGSWAKNSSYLSTVRGITAVAGVLLGLCFVWSDIIDLYTTVTLTVPLAILLVVFLAISRYWPDGGGGHSAGHGGGHGESHAAPLKGAGSYIKPLAKIVAAVIAAVLLMQWWQGYKSQATVAGGGTYPAGSLPTTSMVSDNIVIFTGREPQGTVITKLPPGKTLRLEYMSGRVVTNNTNGWSSPRCGVPLADTLPVWRQGLPYLAEGMNTDAVVLKLSGGAHKAFRCGDNTLEITNTTKQAQNAVITINDSKLTDNEGDEKFFWEIR